MTNLRQSATRPAYVQNSLAADGGPWPPELDQLFGKDLCDHAAAEIQTWPSYAPTPLYPLTQLAERLGIGELLYKDEGPRFGLGSFKALGGAYAVSVLLREVVEQALGTPVTTAQLRDGSLGSITHPITVTTATDGNHGRSVAWGAQQFGCASVIYIHAEVSEARATTLGAYGAEVRRISGTYDDSVAASRRDAERNGWLLVADTTTGGNSPVPAQVMAGYGLILDEILAERRSKPPLTHVLIQGGVGALPAAVAARGWQRLGETRPRISIVEPAQADCLFQSARQGRPATITMKEESIMAGLSCGTASPLAWTLLASAARDFVTIDDSVVAPTMQALANCEYGDVPIVAGESAVAGVAALIGLAEAGRLHTNLGMDEEAVVLVLGTEGATDAEIYQRLVGKSPAAVPNGH